MSGDLQQGATRAQPLRRATDFAAPWHSSDRLQRVRFRRALVLGTWLWEAESHVGRALLRGHGATWDSAWVALQCKSAFMGATHSQQSRPAPRIDALGAQSSSLYNTEALRRFAARLDGSEPDGRYVAQGAEPGTEFR